MWRCACIYRSLCPEALQTKTAVTSFLKTAHVLMFFVAWWARVLKEETFVSCKTFFRTFFEFQLFGESTCVTVGQLWYGGIMMSSLSCCSFNRTFSRMFFLCKLRFIFILSFKTHVSLWPFDDDHSFCCKVLPWHIDCFCWNKGVSQVTYWVLTITRY